MFGLPEKTITVIKAYFAADSDMQWVKVYGSRAMGHYQAGSDIDLAYYSLADHDQSGKILTELDELPTPYKFDVTNYRLLDHQDLKDHIDRVGKILYTNQRS